MAGIILRFFIVLIFFLIIVYFAYYATKFVGLKANGSYSGRNIRIIEGASLNRENTLFLVQMGKKYYVVGCNSKALNILHEIDPKEINLPDTTTIAQIPFKKYFMDLLKRSNSNANDDNVIEEFVETDDKIDFKSKLDEINKRNREDI